jgi:hypothetical protein
MAFANDDGRPLGLLVLMRLVSANSFPYRYKGVHDGTAISRSPLSAEFEMSARNVRLCASTQNPIGCLLPRQPERDVSPLTPAHCLRRRKMIGNNRTTTYRLFDPPRGSEPRCGIGVRCHQSLHRTVGVVRSEHYAVSSACARACGYRVLGWPYTWPETTERIDS